MADLPDTLRARLERIVAASTVGGMAVGDYLPRGDQHLVDMGYVEIRGERLYPTRAGVLELEGGDDA